ncbi:MAG: ABC transporter ATP-binding protein [Victivallaceae bacterium]|nr:ABC transporter ATP-binding protein [Victivallaceae bacterium]
MMNKRQENEKKFKAQSYLRLLRYTRPYWFRLTLGVIAGLLVGGSLFGSLMIIPELLTAAEQPADRHSRTINISKKTMQIVDRIEAAKGRKLSREEKLQAVENILNPSDPDPKLTSSLEKLKKYSQKFGLPVEVKGKREVVITWPVRFAIPVCTASGRMAWQFFGLYVLAFVLGWTIKNLATYANRYYTRWVGAKVIADLRNEAFDKLLEQSLKYYGKMDVGHLISRCTNDTSTIETSVANVIADATRCPIEILSCIIAIYVLSIRSHNYVLILVILIGTPLIVVPVAILGRRIRHIYKSSLAAIAEVISRMHEVFTGILIVKAYNTEELEQQRFRKINRKYFRTIIRALKLQLLMSPLMEIVAVASTLVFLVYSYSRDVNFTVLVALLAPAIMAYRPIKDLAKVTTYLQRSMAAADRYFDLIDTDTGLREKSGAITLREFRNEIAFNDVVFSYQEHRVLDGISFKISRGSLVAVVGETGSGKTTIANLIARFYDVNSGSVTIDGIDVRDLSIKSLRRHIGIVTQDPILFNETIAENIAYGSPEATPAEIEEAAKKANAHKFIVDGRHPEGYNTEVGEKGSKLSGGEKQRIAIARAVLRNPPILILDEATSALDTVTERIVQEALNHAMQNRTVFAIAHRLSTIRNANLIIVLDNGKIVERGTHEELLAAGGIYKKLFKTQFQPHKTSQEN